MKNPHRQSRITTSSQGKQALRRHNLPWYINKSLHLLRISNNLLAKIPVEGAPVERPNIIFIKLVFKGFSFLHLSASVLNFVSRDLDT